MASDSNLIKASFSNAALAAKSSVPDMSKVYQSSVDISKSYMDVISNTMKLYNDRKETLKANKQKQLDVFIKKAEDSLELLYEQDLPMPDIFVDKVEEKIKEYQDDFEKVNTYGKGDNEENKRARRVIMGKLNRLTKGVIGVRSKFQEFGVNAKNINLETADMDMIDPAGLIIDLKNWGNNSNGDLDIDFDENGTAIFTALNYRGDESVDPASFTMEQLTKMYKPIDTKWDTDFVGTLDTMDKSGKSDADKGIYDFDLKTERAYFIKTISDKEEFENVVSRRTEGVGEPSLREALRADVSIPVGILNNMYVSDNGTPVDMGLVFTKLDLNGDNFVNDKDMTIASIAGGADFEIFEKNYDEMIDALTKISHPAFNLAKSTELLADYYVGKEASVDENGGQIPAIMGIQHQQYDDAFSKQSKYVSRQNKLNNNDEDPNIQLGKGHWRRESVIKSTIDQFNQGNVSITDFTAEQHTWVPDGLGNYTSTVEGKVSTMTKDQLMRSNVFGLDNYMVKNEIGNKVKVKTFNEYVGKNTANEFSKVLTKSYGSDFISGDGNVVTFEFDKNNIYDFDISTQQGMDDLMSFMNENPTYFNIYNKNKPEEEE